MSSALLLLSRGGGGVRLQAPPRPDTGGDEAVASLTLAPASPTVVAGNVLQMSATPAAADGTVLTGRLIAWESSDPAVATVSGTGRVTGVAAGSATITATCEGVSASAALTVTAPVVGGDLVDFSAYFADPENQRRAEAILSPIPAVTDTDASGNYIGTTRVPWPWMETNGHTKDLSQAGYYIAENAVSDPVQIGSLSDPGVTISEDNYYGYHYYYDLGLSFWNHYYRTGDPYWRDKALQVTRVWWSYMYGNGTNKPAGVSPREMALAGVMLTAIHEDETRTGSGPGGKSNLWDGLHSEIATQFDNWIYNKYRAQKQSSGVRDPGFILLMAAQLVAVLPDSYVCIRAHDGFVVGDVISGGAANRDVLAGKIAQIIAGAPGGVQGVDGHFACYQEPDGPILYNIQKTFPGVRLGCQPWQMGFMAEGYTASIDALEALYPGRYDAQVAEAAETVRRIGHYFWFTFRKPGMARSAVTNLASVEWRDAPYFTHNPFQRFIGYLDGAFDLTVDAVAGTTALAGVGGKLVQDGLYPQAALYFREMLSGTLTVGADRSVVGSAESDFTTIPVGSAVVLQSDVGDCNQFRVASVEDAHHMTLLDSPGAAYQGAARRSWYAPYYPLSGTLGPLAQGSNVTVTGTGTLALSELQAGDEILLRDDTGKWFAVRVSSVTDDTHFVLGTVWGPTSQSRYTWDAGGYTILRRARDGEARGIFRVQSVSDDNTATLTPAYPGAQLAGRVLWYAMHGNPDDHASTEGNDVRNNRQTNVEANQLFGWLYKRDADPFWLTAGDEIFASSWGHGQGPNTDPYEGGQDIYFAFLPNGRGKEYDQGHRTAAMYLGYRLVGGV